MYVDCAMGECEVIPYLRNPHNSPGMCRISSLVACPLAMYTHSLLIVSSSFFLTSCSALHIARNNTSPAVGSSSQREQHAYPLFHSPFSFLEAHQRFMPVCKCLGWPLIRPHPPFF